MQIRIAQQTYKADLVKLVHADCQADNLIPSTLIVLFNNVDPVPSSSSSILGQQSGETGNSTVTAGGKKVLL